MKDFFLKGVTLSEEEKLVVETVQDLCRKDIGPLAAEVDRDERFPWENIKKINEIGLNGLFIPEAYGGSPVSKTAWLVILRELSKACPSTAIIFATTSHCCYPIVKFGTHKQKEQIQRLSAPKWERCVLVGLDEAGRLYKRYTRAIADPIFP